MQRAFRLLGLATVLLYLAGFSLGAYVFVKTNETTSALCTFRVDLEQRVDGTQRFLDTHPGPEPFPGITRVALKQSLTNQRRTVDSLSNLDC